MRSVPVAVAVACMCMAAGALGDFTWETETSGIVRLEVAIKDQMRNLVDEGQSFGDVHLRTRVGSRMVECHTAKLEPLRCDRQKERFARTWSIADGLSLEQVFALKGNSLFCSILVKKADYGFGLEHVFCNHWRCSRNFYILMQLANNLWQLFKTGCLPRLNADPRNVAQYHWADILAQMFKFVGIKRPMDSMPTRYMRRMDL